MVSSLEREFLGLLPAVLGVAKVSVRRRLQIFGPLQVQFAH